MWERKMIKEKYFESHRLDIYFVVSCSAAVAFLEKKIEDAVRWLGRRSGVFAKALGDVGTFAVRILFFRQVLQDK